MKVNLIRSWAAKRKSLIVIAALAFMATIAVRVLVRAKRDTDFTASVDTTSIVFRLGNWRDSAGLFIEEPQPVDLAVQTDCELFDESAQQLVARRIGVGRVFPNVVLLSMDKSAGLRVAMDIDDGALIFNLDRQQRTASSSDRQFNSICPLRVQLCQPMMFGRSRAIANHHSLKLTPVDQKEHMQFTLRFRAKPDAQLNIPLQARSAVRFEKDGASQLIPDRSKLTLLNPAVTRASDIAISLDNLINGAINNLTLYPVPDSGVPNAGQGTRRTSASNGRTATFRVAYMGVRLSGTSPNVMVSNVSGAPLKPVSTIWEHIIKPKVPIAAVLAIVVSLLAVFLEERHRKWERNNTPQKGRIS